MLKVVILVVAGVFLSTSAIAAGGCFGVQHSQKTASTPASTATQSTETTTAETPAPKPTKPEGKS